MVDIRSDELHDAPGGADPAKERESRSRRSHYFRPEVDVYSTETEMVVLADMPGVRKEDVEVSIHRDELVIEAPAAGRKEEESSLPWGYYRRFKLRTDFDRERIHGHLDEGILRITLPKAISERSRKVSVD